MISLQHASSHHLTGTDSHRDGLRDVWSERRLRNDEHSPSVRTNQRLSHARTGVQTSDYVRTITTSGYIARISLVIYRGIPCARRCICLAGVAAPLGLVDGELLGPPAHVYVTGDAKMTLDPMRRLCDRLVERETTMSGTTSTETRSAVTGRRGCRVVGEHYAAGYVELGAEGDLQLNH